jgi:hypothetical protein
VRSTHDSLTSRPAVAPGAQSDPCSTSGGRVVGAVVRGEGRVVLGVVAPVVVRTVVGVVARDVTLGAAVVGTGLDVTTVAGVDVTGAGTDVGCKVTRGTDTAVEFESPLGVVGSDVAPTVAAAVESAVAGAVVAAVVGAVVGVTGPTSSFRLVNTTAA